MKIRLPLLTALCIFGGCLLAACSQSPTPMEIYQRVTVNAATAASSSMHLTYDVTIAMADSSMEARMDGDVQQITQGDTGAGLAVHLTNNVPNVAPESDTYFRDGILYQNASDRKIKTEAAPEEVMSQLRATQFIFAESAVLQAEMTELPDSKDKQLTFTLSGEQTGDALWSMAQSILLEMGLPQDDAEQVERSYSDITYQMVVSEDDNLKSSYMAFAIDMTKGAEAVALHFAVQLDDIAFNALSEISYPDDLDSYRDLAVVQEEELARLAALMDPTYKPIAAEPVVTNPFGDDCHAAQLLKEEGAYLDYFFWLLYQAQTGISVQDAPTGFATPAEIDSEGLLRLFCFSNDYRIESFADLEEGIYQIPDTLPPLFLDTVLQGYTYDPEQLPGEYGHESDAASFPIPLMQPYANHCRIDTVEVTDAQRLKIAATGLDYDRETPINTQELTLYVAGDGMVFYESYNIKPL